MREIVFYGLGGQGVVTAAQILVRAASLYDGQYGQAIPAFTAERRGAPVHAYIRLSSEPILSHSFVYEPHCVVAFAWTATPWDRFSAVNHRPMICLANLPAGQSERLAELGLVGGYLDADALTQEVLGGGSPPNAAMLGAFSAVTGWVSLDAVVEAILASWPAEIGQRNALTARRAYAAVSKVGEPE